MTRKGKAHETLSLLFHRDEVPPTMLFDGSKEQCQGDFNSLPAKSVLAGTKLILFGRYVLKFYIGIVQ